VLSVLAFSRTRLVAVVATVHSSTGRPSSADIDM
jgi:hypothetical protein